ncbi:pantoate--beta-alanine ligase [Corynebacterium phocae]|uniref:pantoate--beta-alanine ligase (AMP-forming) n=1 Tax=Corynebacterium phocae TaxID=161895 RepID=A0A1L7D5C7_9CORY|nr:pantoate--beta-alanine ligase [Corynebacterium phocae]APT93277.1 pantoate--beta-alanine ligase [Corynebacterium phocae]KAA8721604.1 pantoate--beta-alanine ligase [Corynebacterium phocae]
MSFELGRAVETDDPAQVRMISSAFRKTGCPVALVPLGNGVHAGHVALVRAARAVRGAVVIVAVGDVGDADLEVLRKEKVDVVWHYAPRPVRIRIAPTFQGLEPAAELGTELHRVLSMVGTVMPSHLIMGEKDYELLVATNVALQDLNLPVRVQGVPTVRMPDGVAVSTRNSRVAAEAREQARAISAALTAGAHAAEAGAQKVQDVAQAVLEAAGVEAEYVQVRGADLGEPPEQGDGRLLIAATVGGVRLIDNAGLPLGIGFRNLEQYQAQSR